MKRDLEKLSKEALIQVALESESRLKNQEEKYQKEKEGYLAEKESALEKLRKLQEKDLKQLEKEKNELEKEVKWFRFLLTQLRRMLFGSKSERFEKSDMDIAQLVLFDEYANDEEKQDESTVEKTIVQKRKVHKGRNSIPKNLPVVEHTIEPEEDTTGMKKIGEERTEILEHVPAKFFKLVLVRPKYARLEEDQDLGLKPELKNVVVAGLPARPIEKCLAGNALLSAILINKYVDHLPLYRQKQIFKRADIEIAPSTIDSWIAHLGKLFDPLYQRLVDEIKAQRYLQADETTTKVLDKQKKKKSHLGYYWTYHAPMAKLVAFDYQKGRGADAPRAFLEGFEGVLQTDGYNVYKRYYTNEKVTHLACWAHARRKFEKALQNDEKRAEHAMTEIQKLYTIERQAKDLSADERKQVRIEKALPVINELGKWLHAQRRQVLPKSPIGKAVEYITPLWESLQNYLHDGNLHIDNNLIENSIRPVALGRKNYLFAGSHTGAQRSAMFYSFFACCKLNRINPQKWMEYVLSNIADYKINKLHELLPHHISAEKIEKFKPFWEV